MEDLKPQPAAWTKQGVLEWGYTQYGKSTWRAKQWAAWADEQLALHEEELLVAAAEAENVAPPRLNVPSAAEAPAPKPAPADAAPAAPPSASAVDASRSTYVFTFGKKAGESLASVWATDKGYLRYMIQEKVRAPCDARRVARCRARAARHVRARDARTHARTTLPCAPPRVCAAPRPCLRPTGRARARALHGMHSHVPPPAPPTAAVCAASQKIHMDSKMGELRTALAATGILALYAGELADTSNLPDEERIVRAHSALVRMRTTPLVDVGKRLDEVISLLAPRV